MLTLLLIRDQVMVRFIANPSSRSDNYGIGFCRPRFVVKMHCEWSCVKIEWIVVPVSQITG